MILRTECALRHWVLIQHNFYSVKKLCDYSLKIYVLKKKKKKEEDIKSNQVKL